MTAAFALILVAHALIHLVGFAKGFDLAELPQIIQPISQTMGLVWLAAAVLFLATAASLYIWPRKWWLVGTVATAVSMAAIIPSWSDASFGAAVNACILIIVAFGFLAEGPLGMRASYQRDVKQALTPTTGSERVTEDDLARLPEPVQKYLRLSGAVGQPRVKNFRARMHGRIRNGPRGEWTKFKAEQYNFFDRPARFFYMTAPIVWTPFHGYHKYAGDSASMRIRAAAFVPLINVSGDQMTLSETVTLFNDMCVMAPATLIAPSIQWEPIDAHRSGATFTNAGRAIHAELAFNDVGELVDFRSDDRYQTSPDGQSAKKLGWSTPLRKYRAFGSAHLSSAGEARWHERGRDYAYIELVVDDVRYNVTR